MIGILPTVTVASTPTQNGPNYEGVRKRQCVGTEEKEGEGGDGGVRRVVSSGCLYIARS
jgi:hypothetical protein